jgi:hypothetical protein
MTHAAGLLKNEIERGPVDDDPGQPAIDQAGEPLFALAERQRSVFDTVQLRADRRRTV